MSITIMCLTSAGGLPLFVRKKGDANTTNNMPFSVVASLNGVHMFGKSHGIEIQSTITENGITVWKEFHESIILIGMVNAVGEDVMSQLLESIFYSMVLTVGIDDIKNQKNIERLKRDLRVSFPIIDLLLDCADLGNSGANQNIDLIGLVETILCSENHLLQTVLENYSENVDSLFGCVLIHGRIAVATKNWWTLHPLEQKLLILLITSDTNATSRDIPVFLPFRSPDVPFRLVFSVLIPGVEVCTICGPTPDLPEIDHIIIQCFKSSIDILQAAEQCSPRNFPLTVQFDAEILGLLLINPVEGKFVLSRNLQLTTNKRSLSANHRLDILRTFFYEAVSPFLIRNNESETEGEEESTLETYWCSEYHKCHASRVDDNILCVLYNAVVPTHTMRLLTQKTLKDILFDKHLCW